MTEPDTSIPPSPLDWVAEPISEEAPGGADLWGEDDPAFDAYYQDAMGRLPEADDYARVGLDVGNGARMPDSIFDPKSVALDDELAQIDTLLKRTRDTKLLTLRAQWSVLAGDIEQTAQSVAGLAAMLEALPEAAHPQTEDGPRDRLDAINDLTAMGAMILPLRYLDIAGTGASRRRFMVANGEATPHSGEDDLTVDALTRALTDEKEAVEKTHAALVQFNVSLGRIEAACLGHPTPHTPKFTTLKQEIEAILKVIATADPKLPVDMGTDADAGAPDSEAQPGTTVAATPATQVRSQDEARQRLVAVETYFGRHEPSSAAVLLVTQARQLIGKSLVDAFDILMPNSAELAKVDFISDNGFQLAHPRLRQLANEVLIEDQTEDAPAPHVEPEPQPPAAPEPEIETPEPEFQDDDASNDEAVQPDSEDDGVQEPETPEPDVEAEPVAPTEAPEPTAPAAPTHFKVESAGDAASQILAVETYFRAVEKSSPVPMLLGRARSFIGKDFETILKELVPRID